MSKRDYYDILGLARTASEEDIKKAYRKSAMQHHPDRNIEGDKLAAEKKFKELNEAYECLSDPQKKAFYDQHGHQVEGQHGWSTHTNVNSGNFADIFSSMFGGGMPGGMPGGFEHIFGRRQQQQTVSNLTISLADVFTGKQLRLPEGKILNIPAGVRHGTRFFVDQQFYQILIANDPKFKRSNDDLLIDVVITASESILGITATLTHLDGAQLQFVIPAGIQFGQVVRLAGKGLKNPEIDRVGDLLIRISIQMPIGLTEEQKNFLRTMSYRETINI